MIAMMVTLRRIRWPASLYEARPIAAIVIGGSAALAALVHALSLGEESVLACAALGAGCLLVLYGGMVKQLRNEHRKRAEMVEAIKAEWRRRNALIAAAAALGKRYDEPPPAAPRPARFLFLRERYVRGAVACIIGGGALATIAVYRALDAGDLSVWEATELALGSIVALYGGLLYRARYE